MRRPVGTPRRQDWREQVLFRLPPGGCQKRLVLACDCPLDDRAMELEPGTIAADRVYVPVCPECGSRRLLIPADIIN